MPLPSPAPPARFDRLARLYAPLEYLTLGRLLERCRFHFLPRLQDRTHALVLGDGDGRFLAQLLRHNPRLRADAVDTSAAMLTQLRRRAQPSATRLTTHHADALAFVQATPPTRYDLVVTHFFLDCLTQLSVDLLTRATAARLTPGALWLVSDFRIPPGPLALPARLFVRGLYFAFRLLTGLRVRTLPNHAAALERAGLHRIAQHLALAGILTTEIWALPPLPVSSS